MKRPTDAFIGGNPQSSPTRIDSRAVLALRQEQKAINLARLLWLISRERTRCSVSQPPPSWQPLAGD